MLKTIGGFIVNLLMIGVVAAVGEELVFRGILVRLFREWTGNIHLAVFIPAFLFSALHLQFFGFLPRLLLGVFLGYLFVWTGSLRVPIIIHFINNAFAVIFSFFNSRGWIDIDVDRMGASESHGIILTSVMLSAIMLAVIYYYESRKKAAIK